jgi:poly(3-hydroxybutyrate) depolymerase
MFKEHGGRATFLGMRTPSGLENFADSRMVIVVLLDSVEKNVIIILDPF